MGAERYLSLRILVTGGAGFLGSHVVERLRAAGCGAVIAPRSSECDLRDRAQGRRLFERTRPEVVLHLAGRVGGLGANVSHPGRFFYDNALMGLEVLELARQFSVEKFLSVGTICAYPREAPLPLREESLWDGYPEATNAAYGLAKRMLLVQSQAYRAEYGLNCVFLLPANLYGPRENADLGSSHVVPAIIRKCLEAQTSGERRVVLWGHGAATRDFLFVEDAADGVVRAAFHYDEAEPVNLGTGSEVSIRELAELIATEVGFTGQLVWDASFPSGQPRRRVDTRRAEAFGFRATTSLQTGIRKTVAWYREHRPWFTRSGRDTGSAERPASSFLAPA